MRNTPCKECIFADYERNTQTGCHLDMIQKFKDHNADIIEAYDEDSEFYVVKDRFCHFYRTKTWGKDRELEDNIKHVKDETQISMNAIVFCDDDYKALRRSLGSLYRQTLKPQHITVIRSRTGKIRPGHITDLLQSRNIKWRLENLRVDVDNWRAFHLVQKFCKYPYHVILQSGYKLRKKTIEELNTSVIDNLEVFAMLEDKESSKDKMGSGLIIPTSVYDHVYFHTNPSLTFVENVKQLERDGACQKQS